MDKHASCLAQQHPCTLPKQSRSVGNMGAG
jgi:hypothetical protein